MVASKVTSFKTKGGKTAVVTLQDLGLDASKVSRNERKELTMNLRRDIEDSDGLKNKFAKKSLERQKVKDSASNQGVSPDIKRLMETQQAIDLPLGMKLGYNKKTKEFQLIDTSRGISSVSKSIIATPQEMTKRLKKMMQSANDDQKGKQMPRQQTPREQRKTEFLNKMSNPGGVPRTWMKREPAFSLSNQSSPALSSNIGQRLIRGKGELLVDGKSEYKIKKINKPSSKYPQGSLTVEIRSPDYTSSKKPTTRTLGLELVAQSIANTLTKEKGSPENISGLNFATAGIQD